MSIMDSSIPRNPEGVWEWHVEPHEVLFSKWVLDAHARGLRFDWHHPMCERPSEKMVADFTSYLVDEVPKLETGHLPTPVIKDEGAKWKALSAMQKAVRRGNVIEAWRSTYALTAYGQGASVWRRLVIISMEDVGLGDPYAVALLLVVAGNKALRHELGEDKCLLYALMLLCKATKSRDMCDVIFAGLFLPGQYKAEAKAALTFSDEEMIDIASDETALFKDRVIAHWRMYGPKFKTPNGLNPAVTKGLIEKMYTRMKLPPLIQFVAHTSYRAAGEALGIPVPFVWQLMCASTWAAFGKDPFENGDEAMVQGVYAASLDKHTWAGKGAIRKFCGWGPVAEALEQTCKGDAFTAVERAVFYVEGALLRPRLAYEGSEKLFWEILEAKMKVSKIANLEEGLKLYKVVQDNLGQLNKFRDNK